jgi:hypothetical protein
MKTVATILGLIVIVALVWMLSRWQLAQAPPPAETINEAGIKSDLLAIARAEKDYMAKHQHYGSMNKLQQDGFLPFSGLRWDGYFYTAEVGDDGEHFKITARTTEIAKAHWPIFWIDDTMQISEFAGFIIN